MNELEDIAKFFSELTDTVLPGDLRYVLLGFAAPLGTAFAIPLMMLIPSMLEGFLEKFKK